MVFCRHKHQLIAGDTAHVLRFVRVHSGTALSPYPALPDQGMCLSARQRRPVQTLHRGARRTRVHHPVYREPRPARTITRVWETQGKVNRGPPSGNESRIPAMPFSPSDLPWWGWLLCSAVTLVVAAISWFIFTRSHANHSSAVSAFGYLALLVGVPCGLAGGFTGLIGIILFVKWVWTS